MNIELSQRQSPERQTQRNLCLVLMTGAGHYGKQECLVLRQMVSTNPLQCTLPLLSWGHLYCSYLLLKLFFIAML